jgi:hypothetical protein
MSKDDLKLLFLVVGLPLLAVAAWIVLLVTL